VSTSNCTAVSVFSDYLLHYIKLTGWSNKKAAGNSNISRTPAIPHAICQRQLALLLLLLLEKTDLSCRMPKLQGQVTKSIKQYNNRLKREMQLWSER